MIGSHVYIFKLSNGAWKIGRTNCLINRACHMKHELKVASRIVGHPIQAELKYLFKTDIPIRDESRLLEASKRFKRFMGKEYFFAKEKEIRTIVDDMGITETNIAKTALEDPLMQEFAKKRRGTMEPPR